jgi:hypothetical protein
MALITTEGGGMDSALWAHLPEEVTAKCLAHLFQDVELTPKEGFAMRGISRKSRDFHDHNLKELTRTLVLHEYSRVWNAGRDAISLYDNNQYQEEDLEPLVHLAHFPNLTKLSIVFDVSQWRPDASNPSVAHDDLPFGHRFPFFSFADVPEVVREKLEYLSLSILPTIRTELREQGRYSDFLALPEDAQCIVRQYCDYTETDTPYNMMTQGTKNLLHNWWIRSSIGFHLNNWGSCYDATNSPRVLPFLTFLTVDVPALFPSLQTLVLPPLDCTHYRHNDLPREYHWPQINVYKWLVLCGRLSYDVSISFVQDSDDERTALLYEKLFQREEEDDDEDLYEDEDGNAYEDLFVQPPGTRECTDADISTYSLNLEDNLPRGQPAHLTTFKFGARSDYIPTPREDGRQGWFSLTTEDH